MTEINKDIIFVKGAKNGAIYNFRSGNVYQLNQEGCTELQKYINDKNYFSDYISQLMQMELLDKTFSVCEYIPSRSEASLDMVWLEITQNCNLKCLHCYEGNYHCSSENSMQLEKWIDIIGQIAELKVKRVVVIGGEPLTSPILPDIMKALCDYGISATLFTNATLISNKLMQLIIENKDIIRVKVSIYGHNSEIHDRITTVSGSFEKMNGNIKKLVANGVSVNPAVIIMKENQEYLDEIINYLKEIGLRYTRYDVIRNVFGGTQNMHIPDNNEILKNVKYTKPNFSITKEKFDKNVFYNSCWKGKFAITEDGNVLPCVFERDIVYGNVLNTAIRELINTSITQSCWEKSFDKIKVCNKCEFRYACKDCRPLGKSVSGCICEKNPRCTYDPETGKWYE